MSKVVKTVIIVLLVAVVGIGVYFLINTQIRNSRQVTAKEFKDLIVDSRASDENGNDAGLIPDDQQITKVYVDGYIIYGYVNVNDNTYT